MFRFAKDGRVRWPVSLAQVQEDGTEAAQQFSVVYRTLTRDQLQRRDESMLAYTRAIQALLPADGAKDTDQAFDRRKQLTAARIAEDDALLRDRVVDWSGIVDESDAPVPFSADTLDAFIGNALLRDTLLRGLIDASSGAREKNLSPGLAGMPAPAQG